MEALFALALLACPVGMGLMMWMMRGGSQRESSQPLGEDAEVARLSADVDQLRAARRDPAREATEPPAAG